MTGGDLKLVGIIFNVVVLAVMIVSGVWVGLDARKTGRSKLEAILWGLFAGWFIIIGPIFYVFFKGKFYK